MHKKHHNYFYKYSDLTENKNKNFWRWIGWREFGRGVLYGASMTIGAAIGVVTFYYLCVMILLLEPTL